MSVFDFEKEKQKREKTAGRIEDQHVRNATAASLRALEESLMSQQFDVHSNEMQHDLRFIRRCMTAMINRQFGIYDPVAELMQYGDPDDI